VKADHRLCLNTNKQLSVPAESHCSSSSYILLVGLSLLSYTDQHAVPRLRPAPHCLPACQRALCRPAPRMAATPKQPYRAPAAGQSSHSDLPCGWVSWRGWMVGRQRHQLVHMQCTVSVLALQYHLSPSASSLRLSTLESLSVLESTHHYSRHLSHLAC
jgi:hypothetical protein